MTVAAPPLDPEYEALTAKITRDRGFGCASYKDKCVRRRIAVRMRARGVHTYRDYARVLDREAGEYDQLLDALTINVTHFFRNAEAWASLDALVLAPLVTAGHAPVRLWSAGCSSGEETYTLAILCHRRAAALGRRAPAIEILGTDIDRASLEAAERGSYLPAALAEMPPAVRAECMPGSGAVSVSAGVRALVRFMRHDLLSEPAPPGSFDVIVCRNVVIYFDRRSQEVLLDKFHGALAPSGALMQGKVETLVGSTRARFEALDARERIFRRVP